MHALATYGKLWPIPLVAALIFAMCFIRSNKQAGAGLSAAIHLACVHLSTVALLLSVVCNFIDYPTK